MMQIQIKRAYAEVLASDGKRILVNAAVAARH